MKNQLLGKKYDYVWDYLIPESNNRSEKLEKIFSPFFKKNETVLDVTCGFSPVTSFLNRRFNCHVFGFDINPKSITYCRRKYNRKLNKFYISSDSDVQINNSFDVLLHLGISPSTNPLEPKNDADFSRNYILKYQPRLIILEASVVSAEGIDKLFKHITDMGIYDLVKETTYSFSFTKDSVNPDFSEHLSRKVYIFQKNQKQLFSLDEKTLTRLLLDAQPSSQSEEPNRLNLGFGFFYYSMVRILKPKTTFVFGSGRGFSPICFALGIRDNQNNGKVYFVDAGYSDSIDGKAKGMGGNGFWKDKSEYLSHFKKFGVEKIIDTFVTTTKKFLNIYNQLKLPPIDLLYIDASHSYKGFKYDFERFSKYLNKNGVILFHDVLVENGTYGFEFGIKKYFESSLLHNQKYSVFRIPIWPGVGLAQKIFGNDLVPNELSALPKDIIVLQNQITQQNIQISRLTDENNILKKQHLLITDSKYFKFWPVYTKLKNFFKHEK